MTNTVTKPRLATGTSGKPRRTVRLDSVDRAEAAAWFRNLRREAGLTQWEVAEKLNTDERTIMRMESPTKGWPEGGTLLAFLELMGVLKETPQKANDHQGLGDHELL